MRLPKLVFVCALTGCILTPEVRTYTYDKIEPIVQNRTEECIDSIVENLERIPDSFQEIGNKFGTVVIVDGPLTNQKEFKDKKGKYHRTAGSWEKIPGAYDVETRRAFIRYERRSGSLALHEYGHMIDHALDHISKKKDFLEVYKEYKNSKFLRDHAKSSSVELFAYCFDKYFYSYRTRKMLEGYYPLAHEFFEELDEKVN